MKDFKETFIEFLLSTGALKIDGDFKLKSMQLSEEEFMKLQI